MTDLIRIPFRNTEVLAVDVDGRPHVVLKPAIESIGLDADQQIRKLRQRAWATTVVTTVVAADGKLRQMVVADVRTFLMALATIPETRVGEEVRPLLVAYQAEVADVIEAYWTRGGAINPRASEQQLADLIGEARGQMEVIQLAKGVIHGDYLEAKARLVLARVMAEEPELDATTRPMDVTSYLRERGVGEKSVRRRCSTFGKRLKALYVAEHGEEPAKVDRMVNGTFQRVNGYTEADRVLFDRVFEMMGSLEVVGTAWGLLARPFAGRPDAP